MNTAPGIKDLEESSSFEKVLTLPYNEIGPFVLREIVRPTRPMILTWIALAVSLFLSVWFWPGVVFNPEHPRVLAGLAAGLAGSVWA